MAKPEKAPIPTPEAPAPEDPEVVVVESDGPFGKAWYWGILVFSIAALVVCWIYYSSNLDLWIQLFYFATAIMASILLLWSFFGLLRVYHVAGRLGARAQRFRESRDDGSEGEDPVVYRENIVVRLFRFVGRLVALLFLFVWNTVLRIVYIIEVTILRTLILAYDIIYYVGYAAWAIIYWALRLAIRIVLFALRVAWKILKILTKLPVARGLWANRMRPRILAAWQLRVDQRKQHAAVRLDQKRRLVAAKGKDPDVWQRDWEAHHHYPLPHPHEARKGLRDRILNRQKIDFNRRDRWRAYRKGLPMPPKLHEAKDADAPEEGKPTEAAGRTDAEPSPKKAKPRKSKRGDDPLRGPGDAKPAADER